MDIAKSLFGNRPHEGYAGKEDYNVSWCLNPKTNVVCDVAFPIKHAVYVLQIALYCIR